MAYGVAVGLLAGATAAPPPSEDRVERAERRAAEIARGVPALQADLADARADAEASALRAAQAAEAFNGARYHLRLATDELRRAEREARAAERSVATQRDGIASLVTSTYMAGGDLQSVSAFLGTTTPEDLMGEYVAYSGASASMEAAYQRFQVTSDLARTFAARAVAAREAQLVAAREAGARRDEAAASAAAAVAAERAIAARRDALVAEVARAEDISLALARERQAALEAAQEQAAPEANPAPTANPQPSPEPTPEPNPTPDPAPTPEPAPAPEPVPDPPAPAGGAAKAIAFARAQLGEPYRWGAAGPDAWDCSGLMLGAWEAAGRSLPHWSVAQYTTSVAITRAQLRPGDLVFWGTSGSPDSIHHVALYIGNGQIIHAPRTGRPVVQESIDYWKAPNFFARVG